MELYNGGLTGTRRHGDREDVSCRVIADSANGSAGRGCCRLARRVAGQCNAALIWREADGDCESSGVLQLGDALAAPSNKLARVTQQRNP